MSAFNKYISATNDPTYLGYSREIEGPKPDQSLGKLFSGIGEEIDSGVKGATSLLDIKIQNDTRDAVKTTEDQSGANISLSDAAALGKLKNKAEAGNVNLLSTGTGTEPTTPAVVQDGVSRLDKLYQLYQQGQLSPTYYLTQQQSITQQLLQRYPGSEKEVRAAMHEETSSANQIRSQVFADFQAAAAAANTQNKDWIHFVRSNLEYLGPEGAKRALSPEVLSNQNLQVSVTADVAKLQEAKQRISTRKAQVDLGIAEGTLDSHTAERNLTLDLQDAKASMIKGAMSSLGGLKEKIIEASTSGGFDQNQLAAWRGEALRMQTALDAQFEKIINTTDKNGNNSYNSLIQDKGKIAAAKATAMEDLTFVNEALNHKDPKIGIGLAGYHLKKMEGQIGMDASRLLENSTTMRGLAAVEKAAPGQGQLGLKILNDNANLGTRKTAEGKPISALGSVWLDAMDMFTVNAMSGKPGANIGDVVKPREGQNTPPAVINQTIKNHVQLITSPDSAPETKKNALNHILNDTEGKFFKELDKSSQLQAFNQLSTPQVSKSIFDLGDPALYGRYKDWSTQLWSSMAVSRRGDLQQLTQDKTLNLRYDPGFNSLVWTNPPYSMRPASQPILNLSMSAHEQNFPPIETLKLLNNGIRNLDTVFKQDGSKASDQLTPLFKSMGIPVQEAEGAKKKPAVGKQSSVEQTIPGAKQYSDGNWYVELANGSHLKVNV